MRPDLDVLRSLVAQGVVDDQTDVLPDSNPSRKIQSPASRTVTDMLLPVSESFELLTVAVLVSVAVVLAGTSPWA